MCHRPTFEGLFVAAGVFVYARPKICVYICFCNTSTQVFVSKTPLFAFYNLC